MVKDGWRVKGPAAIGRQRSTTAIDADAAKTR
jgi:hypothetical protein